MPHSALGAWRRYSATRIISGVVAFVFASTTVLPSASAAFAVGAVSSPEATPVQASAPVSAVVREIPESRTASSREFLLDDGNVRAVYYGEPVNYLDRRTGRFEPIDPALADSAEGTRQISVSRANSVRVEIPTLLDSSGVSVEASDCAVRIAPAASASRGGSAPSTLPVSARADSTVERAFPGAFADADLVYESRASGLKESIVLAKPTAETSWAFDMVLDRLTPRLEADGSISLIGVSGVVAFVVPKPFMTDASASTLGGDYSDAVRYEISGTSPRYRLVVVADPRWIAGPERVFPITIDPSVETTTFTLTTSKDTFVSSNYPTTNYVGHNLTWINNHNPAANWEEVGFLQTSSALVTGMATKKSQGRSVVASRLKLYVTPGYVTNPGSVTALMCEPSKAVTLSAITWNTYTGAAHNPSVVPTYQSSYVPVTGGGTKTLDVSRIVASWQDLGVSSYTKCAVAVQGSAGTHVGLLLGGQHRSSQADLGDRLRADSHSQPVLPHVRHGDEDPDGFLDDERGSGQPPGRVGASGGHLLGGRGYRVDGRVEHRDRKCPAPARQRMGAGPDLSRARECRDLALDLAGRSEAVECAGHRHLHLRRHRPDGDGERGHHREQRLVQRVGHRR